MSKTDDYPMFIVYQFMCMSLFMNYEVNYNCSLLNHACIFYIIILNAEDIKSTRNICNLLRDAFNIKKIVIFLYCIV